MKNGYTIILTYGDLQETWGSLMEAIETHFPGEWETKKHTLYRKKYPFKWRGIHFKKIPHRTKLFKMREGE